MMNRIACMALLLTLSTSVYAQDGFRSWHERTEFLMATPGSLKYGLYGFDNPALAAFTEGPDFLLQWSDEDGFTSFNHWGLFSGIPGFGFGAVSHNMNGLRMTDYRLSTAFGNDAGAFGLAYGWYGGNTEGLRLDRTLTMGTLSRPNQYLSVGFIATTSLERRTREAVADLGIRPLGTHRLALFGDYAVHTDQAFLEGRWSAGAAIEPLDGLRITGRYIDDIGFTAGVQLSFGHTGIRTQGHLDNGGSRQYNTYGVRMGAYDRNIPDSYFRRDDSFLVVDLKSPVSYQPLGFFDRSQSFKDLITDIQAAHVDQTVGGVVINLTNMSLNQAMMWEIRRELEHFQETGKQVIAYFERGGMMTLNLASVADKVVMDPQGTLTMPGFSSSTTYLADALTAIGIGVDEFREMEYKSALETLSRTDMSEADREQREDIINRFYELTRLAVTESRDITDDAYDELIDRGIYLTASDLVEAGLVDTLIRLADVSEFITDITGRDMQTVNREDLLAHKAPGDASWGRKPGIAVLYAIGPTMVESGLRARVLAEEIRRVRNSNHIKAVVLRSDSPGGDNLASDLVAEEIRKTREVKPVIVSMGSVAASGGYWISMHADHILVSPYTLTGSIGVASGWFYDEGLSENLRLHYDHVSRGGSADLAAGPSLPLVGLTLPGRQLTEQEREGLIRRMHSLYDDFIDKVASGRGMEAEQIREIAEGRIWTGEQAVENGLVDDIGGLLTAIDLARQEAGLHPKEPFDIYEGPKPRSFVLSDLLGASSIMSRIGLQHPQIEDPVVEYLKFMIQHNGQPQYIMPMSQYQLYYQLMNLD